MTQAKRPKLVAIKNSDSLSELDQKSEQLRNISQSHHRIERRLKKMKLPVSTFEQALATWPLFGGTSAETSSASSGGGGEGNNENEKENETEKVVETAKETTDTHNSDTVTKLTKQLEETTEALKLANQKAEGFEKKEQEAARAQMSKEEGLQTDLDNANATIERLDTVIKNVAINNAILANKDYEWHSSRQVLTELESGQYGDFEVNIDLDNGKAEVTGLNEALKGVAQKCPWLISKDKAKDQENSVNQNGGNGRTVRATGAPPKANGTQAEKQQRRAEMTKRFPVLNR